MSILASPDILFVLTLVLRMAVTAAFVVSASVVTERAGPVIGALMATLPVSAGPSYVFLALDHGAGFIAQGALGSLPINAATMFFALTYVKLAQRRGVVLSLGAAVVVWVVLAIAIRVIDWTLARGIVANAVAFAICLPLLARYRHVRMPLVTRRWYDIPLRAALVSTLAGTVVTLSHTIGPTASGIIALYPVTLTSLMLVLHPRIGGVPTAAVIANCGGGLLGFAVAIAALNLTAMPLGATLSLSLALAICVVWNLALWSWSRRRVGPVIVEAP